MKRNYSNKNFPQKTNAVNLFLFLVCITMVGYTLNAQTSDLSITKTVSDSSPNVGDRITFRITLINSGPDQATGVAVRDVVPSGYGAITNISNGGATTGNNIDWTDLIILPNSIPVELTLNVTVLPTGDYNNRAEIIASDSVDPDSDPNSSFGIENDDLNDGIEDDDETEWVIVTPLISDLSLEKSVDDLEPNLGTEVVFTVMVNNDGPSSVMNVSVRDQLTEGFIWISDDSFGDYNPETGVWTVGDIENDSSTSLNITAIVNTIEDYTNSAEIITADSFDPDSAVDNNDPDEDDQDSVTLNPTGLLIPEGFSPNGDNINDTFEIPGLGYLFPNFEMEIFNRYGNKVFKYSNEGRAEPNWWEGFSDGRLTLGSNNSLPTGTYYYVLYFNQDNIKPLTNWIYLNR